MRLALEMELMRRIQGMCWLGYVQARLTNQYGTAGHGMAQTKLNEMMQCCCRQRNVGHCGAAWWINKKWSGGNN